MSSDGTKLKILIVSQFYYPDITACAFRMHETATLLKKMGHEVHIIGGEPHKAQLDENTEDGDLKVLRVKLYKNTSGKWNYIRHYMSFMLGAIRAARQLDNDYDVVWASSPPLFTGIAGYAIAKEKKCKLCLDIRDIWPESAVVAGQISNKGVLFRAAKIIEKLLYGAAQRITCVAKPMAEHIAAIEPSAKPVVIYNSILNKYLANPPLEPEKNPSTVNILYIGNMGYCQNLSLIVDAAAILEGRGQKSIKFKLIGSGVEKEQIINSIKEKALETVEVCEVVAKSDTFELARHAHALILHLKDDGIMDKTIPSKVFDYMAAGRPIMYGLKGEATGIISLKNGNLMYNPASAEELANAAEELYKNYGEYGQKAAQNYEVVKSSFTREKMTEKLVKEAFK
jgi:glycosyltransferase involved in cell wall biosynthesis